MTDIEATQDDLVAIAEVLKFAALLDDRAPKADKARIAAWAVQIHRHHLERNDLVDAIQAYYDQPHDHAIGIGDLIEHAKRIRRDRIAREPNAIRDARMEALAVKAAEDAAELAERKGIPGPVKYARPTRAGAMSVRCPWCKAEPFRQCVVPMTNDRPADGVHPSRVDLAAEQDVNA